MRALDPQHRLSLNFRVHEACVSETAERAGIDIRLIDGSEEHKNARALAHHTLQPARDHVGLINISSWFRPEKVNRLVGGSPTSEHQTAAAADTWVAGLTPLELAHVFVTGHRIVFNQLILEHDQGIVHISHSRECNQREVLTRYLGADGELHYLPGLVAHDACG